MGEAGKALVFPTLEDIIQIDRYHIATTGGFHNGSDNLRNASSLKWVLDAIQYPLFGEDLYPTIVEKAAVLSWAITADHVFFDGNNRTASSVMLIFLETNGYRLNATDDESYAMTKRISAEDHGKLSLHDYTEWIRARLAIRPKAYTG